MTPSRYGCRCAESDEARLARWQSYLPQAKTVITLVEQTALVIRATASIDKTFVEHFREQRSFAERIERFLQLMGLRTPSTTRASAPWSELLDEPRLEGTVNDRIINIDDMHTCRLLRNDIAHWAFVPSFQQSLFVVLNCALADFLLHETSAKLVNEWRACIESASQLKSETPNPTTLSFVEARTIALTVSLAERDEERGLGLLWGATFCELAIREIAHRSVGSEAALPELLRIECAEKLENCKLANPPPAITLLGFPSKLEAARELGWLKADLLSPFVMGAAKHRNSYAHANPKDRTSLPRERTLEFVHSLFEIAYELRRHATSLGVPDAYLEPPQIRDEMLARSRAEKRKEIEVQRLQSAVTELRGELAEANMRELDWREWEQQVRESQVAISTAEKNNVKIVDSGSGTAKHPSRESDFEHILINIAGVCVTVILVVMAVAALSRSPHGAREQSSEGGVQNEVLSKPSTAPHATHVAPIPENSTGDWKKWLTSSECPRTCNGGSACPSVKTNECPSGVKCILGVDSPLMIEDGLFFRLNEIRGSLNKGGRSVCHIPTHTCIAESSITANARHPMSPTGFQLRGHGALVGDLELEVRDGTANERTLAKVTPISKPLTRLALCRGLCLSTNNPKLSVCFYLSPDGQAPIQESSANEVTHNVGPPEFASPFSSDDDKLAHAIATAFYRFETAIRSDRIRFNRLQHLELASVLLQYLNSDDQIDSGQTWQQPDKGGELLVLRQPRLLYYVGVVSETAPDFESTIQKLLRVDRAATTYRQLLVVDAIHRELEESNGLSRRAQLYQGFVTSLASSNPASTTLTFDDPLHTDKQMDIDVLVVGPQSSSE